MNGMETEKARDFSYIIGQAFKENEKKETKEDGCASV